jgi:hypothetical protein
LAYRFLPTQPGGENAVALWNPSSNAMMLLFVNAVKVTRVNAIGERQVEEMKPGSGNFHPVAVQLNRGSPEYLLWQ